MPASTPPATWSIIRIATSAEVEEFQGLGAPHPNGAIAGIQTTVQRLGWFDREWDIPMPDNFADDYERQPPGVRHYKENVDLNYGRVPDDRPDLWLKHRNYLVNCMRLADAEFSRIVETETPWDSRRRRAGNSRASGTCMWVCH